MNFVKQSFSTVEECAGSVLKAVITSRSSDLLLLAFENGDYALLSAEWDHDEGATFEDVDSEFGYGLFRAFREDDLKAVFDYRLVEQWEKDFEQRQSHINAKREQAEREHYEQLKAKFEKR